MVYSMPLSLHICVFCGRVRCLKQSPSRVLNRGLPCSMSVNAMKCRMEKTGVFDKFGPGTSHSAVGHYELNVNESIICTKVSSNRSTRNTGYVLIS